MIYPVLNEKQQLIGVIDFNTIRAVIFNTFSIKFTTISEVMTQPKETLDYHEGMESIMEKFDSSKADFLPVIKQGTFIGIVAKKAILESYREKLKQMTIE
jgi:CIC family chloride channel protein